MKKINTIKKIKTIKTKGFSKVFSNDAEKTKIKIDLNKK